MDDKAVVVTPVVKAGAAIGAAVSAQVLGASPDSTSIFADLLVLTWGNIASAAAAMLSISLLIHHWWKVMWRPLLERLGWIKPKQHRKITRADLAALADTDL